jgi:hypothetical protein
MIVHLRLTWGESKMRVLTYMIQLKAECKKKYCYLANCRNDEKLEKALTNARNLAEKSSCT